MRDRVKVDVVTDAQIALKRVARPSFKRSHILREDLVVMESHVTTIKLNRPIYVGFAVLDLSKLWMYDFHYNKMTKSFKNINLCFTDTGKYFLIIQISTKLL